MKLKKRHSVEKNIFKTANNTKIVLLLGHSWIQLEIQLCCFGNKILLKWHVSSSLLSHLPPVYCQK